QNKGRLDLHLCSHREINGIESSRRVIYDASVVVYFFHNDRRLMNHKASRQGDNLMKQALISMLIVAGLFTSLNGRPAPTPPTVGQPAPDFTLADLSGKTHSLKDYRGKGVVVGFISARCPISNAYKERVRPIAD